MKRRRIDPRRAKLHYNYTVEEAARLFGTHRQTVRAWTKAGLKPIDGQRPSLFTGVELRRFLGERRAARKRPTPPGMIYCLGCREHRRPAGGVADYLPRTASTGDLQGICPDCDAMLYRRVNLAALEAVRADLEVTIREADPRIRQREEPSLNHDSTTPMPTPCQRTILKTSGSSAATSTYLKEAKRRASRPWMPRPRR